MKNIKQYYKELGKIVYAVAITDGTIKPEEVEALHEFVIRNLANYELSTDSSGMNKAFYVDFEFENSVETHLNIETAIRSFARFIHVNYEKGDELLLQHSYKLIEKVADAYSREKEKEVVLKVKSGIDQISKNILLNI